MVIVLSLMTGLVSSAQTVRNPAEPHYGELAIELEEDLVLGSEKYDNYLFYRVWDIQADDQGNIYVLDSGAHRIQKYDKNGKYLCTLGRKGQGPGEFELPILLTFDKNGNLYVGEMAKIHAFDPDGKFVGVTKIPFFYTNFCPDGEGNFAITGRITTEEAQNLGVLIIDSEGKTHKKIAEFPGLPVHETGTTVSHPYSPEIRLAAMIDKGFVYGYNLEYKLYIAAWSGRPFMCVEKEEPAQVISRKEKNRILSDLAENTKKAELGWSKSLIEKMANIPRHRPFFDRILVDDKGRIYVRRRRSVLEENAGMRFDIFGNDGHYLYTTGLPFVPACIKDGFMYNTTYSENTGEMKVIRYRIKNWDRIFSALD
jgi:hypothetical protein